MSELEPTGVQPRHPLIELTLARIFEFVRDPSALFWVFGFPVVLAVVLGIAFRNQGPEVVQIAVTGPGSAALLERLDEANGDHGLTLERHEPAEAAQRLRTGRDLLVLEVGPAVGQAAPAITCRLDPTRPGALAARLAIEDRIQRAYGRTDVLQLAEQRVEEEGGRYIDFLVPGLIGLNIMSSCMWGMGYAIVDSRRRKLLKRFAVTPMNRAHYLLAYILSRLAFLVVEVALLVTFGWLVFDVNVNGSLAALGLIAVLGMLCFSGMALLVASRTESTETAAGYMNLIQLPMWLLAGSFFAYSRFPEVVHPLIRLLPLTAFNDAARAVVNDGASIVAAWHELLVLAVWAALSFLLALRAFRWQ